MHTEIEPMDTGEAPEYQICSTRAPKTRTKAPIRTIRKLNVMPTKEEPVFVVQSSCSENWKILQMTLFLVSIAALVVYVGNSLNFYQELKHQYYMAYEQLSRETSTLCLKSPANFTPIVQAIEDTVIGQPHLPEEIGEWFKTVGNAPFNCALFVGGTGVGKSLTASVIAKHYPYPSNVLYVTGNECGDERKRYAAFKTTLFKIQRATLTHGNCAHYLLVMDHISLDEMRLVTKISDRLRTVSKQYHLQLQALFVFRAGKLELRKDTLTATIPEARLVEFKPIGSNELEECIRREAFTMGMDLGGVGYLVQLVANQINATRHGCKPVRAKLSLYSVELDKHEP